MKNSVLMFSVLVSIFVVFSSMDLVLAEGTGNICNKGCELNDKCSEPTPYLCEKSWSLDWCVAKGYDAGFCGGKTDEGGYCFECSGGCYLQSELGEKCGLFTTCAEDEYCCKRAEWYKSNTCKPKHSDMGCCGGPPAEGDRIAFLKTTITNNEDKSVEGKVKWKIKTKGISERIDYSSDCVEGNPEIKIESGQSMTVTCTSEKLPKSIEGPHEVFIQLGDKTSFFKYGTNESPSVNMLLVDELNREIESSINTEIFALIEAENNNLYLKIDYCEIDWDEGVGWERVIQNEDLSFIKRTISHTYSEIGNYIIKVRCANEYFISDIISRAISITNPDATPPAVSVILGDEEDGDDETDNDGLVWAKLSASDTESGISSCKISWNNGDVWWVAKKSVPNNWLYSEGTYIVKYSCINGVGLSSTSSDAITISISESKPSVNIVLSDEKGGENNVDDDGYIWAHISHDENTYIPSCKISWDGGAWDYVDPKIYDIPHNYKTTGLKTVRYKCTNIKGTESEEASDTITVSSISSSEPRLEMLFIPMKWSGTSEEFNLIVDNAVNKFIEDMELNECPDKLNIVKMNAETEIYNRDIINDCESSVLFDMVEFAEEMGYNPSEYDIIIGFIKEDDNVCSYSGLTNSNIIWTTTEHEITMSHEFGHIFGLVDQYCSNPAGSTDGRCNDGGDSKYFYRNIPDANPLSNELGCEPSGEPCCNFGPMTSCGLFVNYGVCCHGNKNSLGGRSTMSYANAEGPRAFDTNEINYLSKIPQLQC